MGFNNKGVDHLVARLRRARYSGVRGVSIGKNADTPLEQAAEDYVACLEKVYPHADYVAVNVSSPNTARLRELQAPDGLRAIVGPLLEARARAGRAATARVPLLVKIAPDLDTDPDHRDRRQPALARSRRRHRHEHHHRSCGPGPRLAAPTGAAGSSGAPLHARSVAVIRQLRAELGSGVSHHRRGRYRGRRAGLPQRCKRAPTSCRSTRASPYRGPALLEEILDALRSDAARNMITRLVEQFQRDGACPCTGPVRPDEIEELRAGIDLNLERLSPRAKVASTSNDPGKFVEDFCTWQDNPHYRRFIFDSALAATAGRLMRSTTARLYHDHMLTKEPATRQPTPWHQDQPYYNIDGSQNVSFWIPVDPVSRPSTLEFVAGSHRGPWLMPRTFMDAQAKWFPEGSLADLPNIEARRQDFPYSGLGAEAGGCGVLSHADAARLTRRRGEPAPPRVLRAFLGR